MRFGDVDHGLRVLARRCGLAAPHVDQTRVEVRVGRALRVAQPLGQADRVVGAIARLVGETRHPQQHPGHDVTDHPRVVADREAIGVPRHRVVRGDALLEVVDPRLQPGEHALVGPDQQMAFDPRARVVEALGETQELLADPLRLLELGQVDVEGREPTQDRKELRNLTQLLAELQRALVRLLGLGRVALGRHQDPGQARLERDLRKETLLGEGCRRQDLEQIPDERRRSRSTNRAGRRATTARR